VPAPETAIRYRVPFFDTDAMQVVHHANYVRYLELVRVQYLEDHDAPYARYIEQGLHFAVTRCEVHYRRPARFGDELVIRCWLQRVGGASLEIGYAIERGEERLATARTQHALVDLDGRPVRLAPERRTALQRLVAQPR
jgi:acyl-CoA thioester hydrolase